ncbi:paired box protein Pax-4 [Chanos chanos]|uniref:Paired box protein Pax-4 n=1 Tax=Chanos chanos TaxID=29144 RepID=A0A6J2VHL5_CHACN|nr:paired box protein Pax-4 [Chanos chanos]
MGHQWSSRSYQGTIFRSRFILNTPLGRGCLNQLGGVYLNGRPLPANKRKVMIELASEGVRPCEISRILKVSNGCVSKILGRYQKTGLLGPKAVGGSRPRLLTTDVIACITKYKQRNPTMFAWEIREKLLADGVCSIEKIPSVSSINRTLKKFQYNHGMEGLTGSWESHNSAEKVWEIMIGERQEKRLNNVEQTDLRQPGIHQGNSQNRNRTTFSPEQCEVLEQEFLKGQYPDLLTREKIATETSLPEDTVKVWFSNRRAKLRREINAKHDVRESKDK